MVIQRKKRTDRAGMRPVRAFYCLISLSGGDTVFQSSTKYRTDKNNLQKPSFSLDIRAEKE